MEADYGIINVGDRILEVYILDKEVTIQQARGITLNTDLSDGRFVIGGSYRGLFNRALRTIRMKKGGLEIKTLEPIRLRRKIDRKTRQQIIDELLTRRCDVCKSPTRYDINFETFKHEDIFSSSSMGYTKNACLQHLNQLINQESKPWEVCKYKSELHECRRVLGRVKYNNEKKEFVASPSIPKDYPMGTSSLAINGKIIYRFNQETGILEMGDEELVERIREEYKGDFWKGAAIQIMLPFQNKPTKLSGIREIRTLKQ